MRTHDIRLIALDLDGTLLGKDQIIAPDDLSAVRSAIMRGVTVALCSGRTSDNMSAIAVRHGLRDAPILSLNGGYCVDKPFGTCLSEAYFGAEALERCLSVIGEYPLTYGMFQRNTVYSIAKAGDYDEADRHWGVLKSPGRACLRHGFEAYQAQSDKQINKLVIVDDDAEVLKTLRERLIEIQGIDVSSSWKNNLELMPEGVDKGAALRALAESLGVSREQVMAIGDYDTDANMIRYAALGVAMGNASEGLKSVAHYVTDTNEQGGVGKAILRFAAESHTGGTYEREV